MNEQERRQSLDAILATYLEQFKTSGDSDDDLVADLTIDDVQQQYFLAANHAMYVALLSRDAMFGKDDQLATRIEAMIDDVLTWNQTKLK